MFGASLQQYFTIYQFPTGRRLFALHEVAQRARQRGLTALLDRIETTIEQCQQTASMEAGWRRSRSTLEGKRLLAAKIDIQLDRVLGAIATQLTSLEHAFGDDGLGAQASTVLRRIFPEGAGAITRLSYENELSAATVVYEDLIGPHADDVEALGISMLVERLGELLPIYQAALSQATSREVSFDRIREARNADQEAMLKVVAIILGMFVDDEEAQVDARTDLLAPILSQQRRLKEAYANRRSAPDVNPETGEEEVSDDDEDTDPPPEDPPPVPAEDEPIDASPPAPVA